MNDVHASRAAAAALILQQGKLLDSIDQLTERGATPEAPEAYVRQEIATSLVGEYRNPKSNIAVEFTLH